MIIRSLVASLLAQLAAGGALRQRQANGSILYRVLEIDVQVRLLVQPITVETFFPVPTIVEVFPGVSLSVTRAPTLVNTALTGTDTVTIISSRTRNIRLPALPNQTPQSIQPVSSTVSTTTVFLPTASFPSDTSASTASTSQSSSASSLSSTNQVASFESNAAGGPTLSDSAVSSSTSSATLPSISCTELLPSSETSSSISTESSRQITDTQNGSSTATTSVLLVSTLSSSTGHGTTTGSLANPTTTPEASTLSNSASSSLSTQPVFDLNSLLNGPGSSDDTRSQTGSASNAGAITTSSTELVTDFDTLVFDPSPRTTATMATDFSTNVPSFLAPSSSGNRETSFATSFFSVTESSNSETSISSRTSGTISSDTFHSSLSSAGSGSSSPFNSPSNFATGTITRASSTRSGPPSTVGSPSFLVSSSLSNDNGSSTTTIGRMDLSQSSHSTSGSETTTFPKSTMTTPSTLGSSASSPTTIVSLSSGSSTGALGSISRGSIISSNDSGTLSAQITATSATVGPSSSQSSLSGPLGTSSSSSSVSSSTSSSDSLVSVTGSLSTQSSSSLVSTGSSTSTTSELNISTSSQSPGSTTSGFGSGQSNTAILPSSPASYSSLGISTTNLLSSPSFEASSSSLSASPTASQPLSVPSTDSLSANDISSTVSTSSLEISSNTLPDSFVASLTPSSTFSSDTSFTMLSGSELSTLAPEDALETASESSPEIVMPPNSLLNMPEPSQSTVTSDPSSTAFSGESTSTSSDVSIDLSTNSQQSLTVSIDSSGTGESTDMTAASSPTSITEPSSSSGVSSLGDQGPSDSPLLSTTGTAASSVSSPTQASMSQSLLMESSLILGLSELTSAAASLSSQTYSSSTITSLQSQLDLSQTLSISVTFAVDSPTTSTSILDSLLTLDGSTLILPSQLPSGLMSTSSSSTGLQLPESSPSNSNSALMPSTLLIIEPTNEASAMESALSVSPLSASSIIVTSSETASTLTISTIELSSLVPSPSGLSSLPSIPESSASESSSLNPSSSESPSSSTLSPNPASGNSILTAVSSSSLPTITQPPNVPSIEVSAPGIASLLSRIGDLTAVLNPPLVSSIVSQLTLLPLPSVALGISQALSLGVAIPTSNPIELLLSNLVGIGTALPGNSLDLPSVTDIALGSPISDLLQIVPTQLALDQQIGPLLSQILGTLGLSGAVATNLQLPTNQLSLPLPTLTAPPLPSLDLSFPGLPPLPMSDSNLVPGVISNAPIAVSSLLSQINGISVDLPSGALSMISDLLSNALGPLTGLPSLAPVTAFPSVPLSAEFALPTDLPLDVATLVPGLPTLSGSVDLASLLDAALPSDIILSLGLPALSLPSGLSLGIPGFGQSTPSPSVISNSIASASTSVPPLLPPAAVSNLASLLSGLSTNATLLPVVSQLMNSLLPGVALPSVALPGAVSLGVGLGIGASGAGLPGIGIPGLTFPGATFAISSLSTSSLSSSISTAPTAGVVSVNSPSSNPGLPGLGLPGIGLPGVSLPSIGIPSINLPGLGFPSSTSLSIAIPTNGVSGGILSSPAPISTLTQSDTGLVSIALSVGAAPNLGLTLGLPGFGLPGLVPPNTALVVNTASTATSTRVSNELGATGASTTISLGSEFSVPLYPLPTFVPGFPETYYPLSTYIPGLIAAISYSVSGPLQMLPTVFPSTAPPEFVLSQIMNALPSVLSNPNAPLNSILSDFIGGRSSNPPLPYPSSASSLLSNSPPSNIIPNTLTMVPGPTSVGPPVNIASALNPILSGLESLLNLGRGSAAIVSAISAQPSPPSASPATQALVSVSLSINELPSNGPDAQNPIPSFLSHIVTGGLNTLLHPAPITATAILPVVSAGLAEPKPVLSAVSHLGDVLTDPVALPSAVLALQSDLAVAIPPILVQSNGLGSLISDLDDVLTNPAIALPSALSLLHSDLVSLVANIPVGGLFGGSVPPPGSSRQPPNEPTTNQLFTSRSASISSSPAALPLQLPGALLPPAPSTLVSGGSPLATSGPDLIGGFLSRLFGDAQAAVSVVGTSGPTSPSAAFPPTVGSSTAPQGGLGVGLGASIGLGGTQTSLPAPSLGFTIGLSGPLTYPVSPGPIIALSQGAAQLSVPGLGVSVGLNGLLVTSQSAAVSISPTSRAIVAVTPTSSAVNNDPIGSFLFGLLNAGARASASVTLGVGRPSSPAANTVRNETPAAEGAIAGLVGLGLAPQSASSSLSSPASALVSFLAKINLGPPPQTSAIVTGSGNSTPSTLLTVPRSTTTSTTTPLSTNPTSTTSPRVRRALLPGFGIQGQPRRRRWQ